MPDEPTPTSPVASPYGAFRVSALGAPGLTREQARTRSYVRPSRGVRYPADATDLAGARAEAALHGVRPGAVLSGISAARLWRMPLPAWIELADDPWDVAVAVPAGGAHPDRQGVRGRRLLLPDEHLTTHRGLPTTTPDRTWVDCAADIPIEHLVAMGDDAIRRRLCGPASLQHMVTWARRRRGVTNARRALRVLDPRSESPGESRARALLVLNGVPRPECNRDIIVRGEWLARVDMCWPEARLIVEYDGLVHLSETRRRSDAQRRNLLQDAGWLVIVLTAADLGKPWLMAALVKQTLTARTPR